MENLAIKICNLLDKYDAYTDVAIYYDERVLNKPNHEWINEHISTPVNKIVEYTNPETITMTFEGTMYYFMNYAFESESGRQFLEEFDNLLDDYGLYYELGYAWSLTLYEN